MPLSDLFKSKEELADEQKKQQNREFRNATRSSDKIQADLERQEKEIETQIKQAAKRNDVDLAKTLAKHLVKVRQQKTHAIGAKSRIGSMANHATVMQTNEKLASVMANSAATMSKVNQQLKPEELMKTVSQFQEENMKVEMGGQAFEEMFEEIFEEEDQEADAIMNQVLDEIGIETSSALAKVPSYATLKDPVASSLKSAAQTSKQQVDLRRH